MNEQLNTVVGWEFDCNLTFKKKRTHFSLRTAIREEGFNMSAEEAARDILSRQEKLVIKGHRPILLGEVEQQ